MPLSEFLRMARGKLESAQHKAISATDLSSVHDSDLVELVWENGQIMMQGQPNMAKKGPIFNDVPSQMPGTRDKFIRDLSNTKIAKLGLVDSVLDDGPPSVPSAEISFNRDDETMPWLNYSVDDGFRQDYYSELLPEISGVTGNGPSHINFSGIDKRNCSQIVGHSLNVPVHNDLSIELRSAPKVSSSSGSSLSLYSPHQGQISVPNLVSGILDIGNSASHTPGILFGDSAQNHASGSGMVNMKIQKQNAGSSGSGSRLLNFSHFTGPAALFRGNLQKTEPLSPSCSSVMEKVRKEENVPAKNCSIPTKSTFIEPSSKLRREFGFDDRANLVPPKVDSRPPVAKLPEELFPAEPDRLCQDDSVKNDKCSAQAIDASTTKEVKVGEKTLEPAVAASSVCSGNSAERASNDQIHNAKRKYRDNEESDCRSEDIEEESVGVKKSAPARGGSASKRSRAAEVHNLSERRRRDRINEKMRALQELIPNCNKADKASMLDEAIEYLKTLQLQVQIMSMGAGLCMSPMMFPTGLQHMHAAHLPHFSPVGSGMGVGMGMGMGMGFGMGMLDLNSGPPRFPMFPVPPMHGSHFPFPPISGSSTFQGITGPSIPVFGLPGQGPPVSVPRAPLVPLSGQASISATVGLNGPRMGIPVEGPGTSPAFSTNVCVQNKNVQLIQNANASSSVDQIPAQLQAANNAQDQPASSPKDGPILDASSTATFNSTASNDVPSSKEGSDL